MLVIELVAVTFTLVTLYCNHCSD